jgi:hypothetical protein
MDHRLPRDGVTHLFAGGADLRAVPDFKAAICRARFDIVKPLENQVFKCGGQGPPAHL